MRYPDVSPGQWARRHNIPIETFRCPCCGGHFYVNIPCAMSDAVGFDSGDHGCGEAYTMLIVRPLTREARTYWEKVVRVLTNGHFQEDGQRAVFRRPNRRTHRSSPFPIATIEDARAKPLVVSIAPQPY